MTDNLPTAPAASPMLINYTDRVMLDTIRNTVAVGTTDAEFRMAVEFLKSTGLNPFKKEAWVIVVPEKTMPNGYKRPRQVQIMTGINGFFSIANKHPMFDGYESGLVGPNGELLPQTYPKDNYIGAWCRVHRKDRGHPTEVAVMLKEYDKEIGQWKTGKRTMILKCAEAVGLRKSFPQELGGLYAAEEMPPEYDIPRGSAPVAAATVTARTTSSLPPLTSTSEPTYDEEEYPYVYDRATVSQIVPEKERKLFWKTAQKTCGAIMTDAEILSSLPIPGLEGALKKRHAEHADEDTHAEIPDASDVDDDDLPESMGGPPAAAPVGTPAENLKKLDELKEKVLKGKGVR